LVTGKKKVDAGLVTLLAGKGRGDAGQVLQKRAVYLHDGFKATINIYI
jgi:hypothetical protein